MSRKVYLVNVEASYDGDHGSCYKIFSNLESAKNYALKVGRERHLYADVYEKNIIDVPDQDDHHREVQIDDS